MMKFSPKTAAPALVAALALLAGAWTFAPGALAFAQGAGDTPTPGADTATAGAPTATAAPTGTAPAETATPAAATESPTAAATATSAAGAFPPLDLPSGLPENEKQILERVYAYTPDFSSVTPGGFSQEDLTALDALSAQNMGSLQMLQLAEDRAHSGQVRSLARVLVQMHQKDQVLLNQLGQLVCPAPPSISGGGGSSAGGGGETAGGGGSSAGGGGSSAGGSSQSVYCTTGSGGSGTAPSLSKVPVLPQSPLGRLGFTNIDLKGAFMDKISGVSGAAFDQAFLTQMMAAHTFAVETAHTVQATAGDAALRDLADHLAQEEDLHYLLLLQVTDRVVFGQELKVVYPTAATAGETPTPAVTPAPSETATAPVETATAPVETATAPVETATAPADTATAPVETATPSP